MTKRVFVIGLDAFEITLAERMMAEGELPHMKQLRRDSAKFRLDHGGDKYSGLAWQHFSTGLRPTSSNSFSAVDFYPDRYHVGQRPGTVPSAFARFGERPVLFDVPYTDLDLAPNVRGVSDWGAHDPGAPKQQRPSTLRDEMDERFGPYPAPQHIYAFTWPSAERCAECGRALTEAVERRTAITRWLFTERLPDWDVGVTVVSEPHSVIEPLWHGVDPTHPLHGHPSAAAAGEAVRSVYRAVDKLIGTMMEALPDVALFVFSMHGMGSNGEDVPSMVALPELLYRAQFGEPYMAQPEWDEHLDDASLIQGLPEKAGWHWFMTQRVPRIDHESVTAALAARSGYDDAPVEPETIDWQPAARYRHFWPMMDAFALPSFYDGRLRVNLKGRERYGRVDIADYPATIARLRHMISNMRYAGTGEPVVREFVEPEGDPLERDASNADLIIRWRGIGYAFDHPRHGRIGPIPPRRTGGHSGKYGFLYANNTALPVGKHGVRSSFDVLPTVLSELGETPEGMDGAPITVPQESRTLAAE